jgi:NAD(P)-dependent dehydrogenase (short-subunit alcohol dehydrogenase family)
MSAKWTVGDIPDQRGRTAVVTGSNSGLGLVTARELARAGANVVIAARNAEKAATAQREIQRAAPDATVEVSPLDLASLDSVRAFAGRFRADHDGLDLLVNNAGVMASPRRETADGFELQFGTNHLGHFALTAQLIGAMEGRPDARVVTVTSTAHRTGRINFDNLQGERRYFRWLAYSQSKLSNILFALELERRLEAAGSPIKSVAAHPGYAATNLQSAAPPMVDRIVMAVSNRVIAQSADMGALPILWVATDPGIEGGAFAGPDGIAEQRGYPKLVVPSKGARDEEVARRLWTVSEELTGVRFEIPAGAAAA